VPKLRLEFSAKFTEEYQYWFRADERIAERIDRLIKAIEQQPFSGIGKPEPLRSVAFKGCWSRRITGEHRLVYRVTKGAITFLQCRYHY
jgi:toxin YoeB